MSKKVAPRVQFNFEPDVIEEPQTINNDLLKENGDVIDEDYDSIQVVEMPEVIEKQQIVEDNIFESMKSKVNKDLEISEIDEAGFTLRDSHLLQTPSINESLVALECKLHSITKLGEYRNLTLGEVINISTNTDVLDTEKNYVNIDNYRPIARLFGNMYSQLSDFFELKRLNYEQWMEDKKDK